MGSQKTYSSSFKVLHFPQFMKLDALMSSPIQIHGQGTFPSIKVTLKEFVMALREKLHWEGVPLESVRLNGGAASHVIGTRQMIDDIGYNDLDLIFGLGSDDEHVFEQVRKLLYETLRTFLPTNSAFDLDSSIDDGYVQKMVKVSNQNDCWSLISLYNNEGENVEIKYVHKMKRQYEFSVDSFQIELDSLLNYYKYNTSVKFTKDFFPTVMAESKFGKFNEAEFHLNNKMVATLRPEEIRGGGLLKYCNLLLNGYNIADSDIKNLERYMCSRFFIDFPDASSQQNKLQSYMRTHLRKAPKSKILSHNIQSEHNTSSNSSSNERPADDGSVEQHRINFISIVRRVIDESTVCLMNIERACTLSLLDNIISDLMRSFMSKNEGKLPLMPTSLSLDVAAAVAAANSPGVVTTAESGYFSENSSLNSLSGDSSLGCGGGMSTSRFSRSSSPAAFSSSGLQPEAAPTHCRVGPSRSPSPATFSHGPPPHLRGSQGGAAGGGRYHNHSNANNRNYHYQHHNRANKSHQKGGNGSNSGHYYNSHHHHHTGGGNHYHHYGGARYASYHHQHQPVVHFQNAAGFAHFDQGSGGGSAAVVAAAPAHFYPAAAAHHPTSPTQPRASPDPVSNPNSSNGAPTTTVLAAY